LNDPWVVVVIIGIICVIASWLVKEPKSSLSVTKEMEDALDLVAANLEEENRQLLATIAQTKQASDRRYDTLEHKTAQLEKRVEELSAELRNVIMLQLQKEAAEHPGRKAADSYEKGSAVAALPPQHMQHAALLPQEPEQTPSQEKEKESTGLRQRYGELFQLHQQGKSIEQIAKKLGLNKGETALILQLAKQEEEGRA
jgi:hypothetical protein